MGILKSFKQHPIRNLILTVIGLLLVVAIAGLLLFETIVGAVIADSRMQAWIKSQVEEQSGGTFTFEGTSGDLLAVELTNIEFTAGAENQHVQKVSAPRLTASFEVLPILFEQKLKLKGLTFHDGVLQVRLRSSKAEDFMVPLGFDSIQLNNMKVEVENLSGWKLGLEGANLYVTQNTGESWKSVELDASRGTVGAFSFADPKVKAQFKAGALEVESFQAGLLGGQLEISGLLEKIDKAAIKDMKLKLSGFDIASTLKAVGYSEKVEGQANLQVTTSGIWTPQAFSLKGNGKLDFSNLSISLAPPDLPSIPIPGINLGPLKERLSRFENLKGQMDVELAGASFLATNLAVEGPDLKISGGSGEVGTGKGLEATFDAIISREIVELIPGPARSIFKATENEARIVPAGLGRTTLDPKITLQAEVMEALQNLTSINPIDKIKGIF